ncbi:13104_t:CDS:2, partial [Entrophospora sp. SA101]
MTETPLKQRYMVITSSWEAGTRQLVSVNKFSTSTELANILNAHNLDLNVSNWTVLNDLHNMQYRSTVPKSIPLLTTITTDCFREIIQKEWEGIETETFVNLVRSMSRRLEDVIAGN